MNKPSTEAPIGNGKPHRWRRYPAYKPSGVEWLGEVPEGWGAKRLKFTVDLINKKVDATNSNIPYLGLENIESWTGRFIPNEAPVEMEGLSNQFKNGDVLLGKLRPYLAKALRATDDGICTSELLVLHPTLVQQDFLLYYILSKDFITIIDSSTYGAKMPRANWDFIGNLISLLPHPSEQSTIATFLDRETARIDALIAKKERQIELLQEKRAALISHAVTCGLDPTVPMKDSEIEWLGMVPDGWEVSKIKWLSSKIGSGKTPRGGSEIYQDSGILFIRSQNVHFNGLILDDIAFISSEIDAEMTTSRVVSSDILLNITGASLGRCSIVPENLPKANVNQHVCIVRSIRERVYPEYLNRYLSSSIAQWQIFRSEEGVSREGLNYSQISNIVVILPPLMEQKKIYEYLNSECTRIHVIMEKIQVSIGKLREYRSALISAAVTGKIDVRQEAKA
jgi:type I restriction enzyme, S subunit